MRQSLIAKYTRLLSYCKGMIKYKYADVLERTILFSNSSRAD